MLKKVRRAFHASKALQSFANDDPAEALRAVERMRSVAPLSVAERMWTYWPLVLIGRFDEAFKVLDEVCRQTDGLDDEDSRFINLCARAARAYSNGDDPLQNELLRQAGHLKPRKSVRMWSQLC